MYTSYLYIYINNYSYIYVRNSIIVSKADKPFPLFARSLKTMVAKVFPNWYSKYFTFVTQSVVNHFIILTTEIRCESKNSLHTSKTVTFAFHMLKMQVNR